MPEEQNISKTPRTRTRAPAIDPVEREKQIIARVIDSVERKAEQGTLPTAVMVHYLRLATEKEKLEREKLRKEIALLEAKKQVADASMRMEQIAKEAIEAITSYGSSINRDMDFDESK